MIRSYIYIHQRSDWPFFTWNDSSILPVLSRVRKKHGFLLGRMVSLGFESQNEANLRTLTDDIVESSAIEGEHFDRSTVRSSVARRLHIEPGNKQRSVDAPRHVEGMVKVLLDAITHFDKELTEERLFGWHSELFPYGHIDLNFHAVIGGWRQDGVQVVSGNIGYPTVHMEGVPSSRVEAEMLAFLEWLKNSKDQQDGLIRSAIAHLWFVTIHPFEDGNGRIARAIADMVLAQDDGFKLRFYSLSHRLRQDRSAYYRELEQAQRGTLDITDWIIWYLECLERSLEDADIIYQSVMRKERFFRDYSNQAFSERQMKMIHRIFDGLSGKLTPKTWAKMAKCSSATATRDLAELVSYQVLESVGSGRNRHYILSSTYADPYLSGKEIGTDESDEEDSDDHTNQGE